ncbi:L-ascorbate peroxidase 1, cytosolic [Orobanche gracilis]
MLADVVAVDDTGEPEVVFHPGRESGPPPECHLLDASGGGRENIDGVQTVQKISQRKRRDEVG